MTPIQFEIKPFEALSAVELYAILQLRSEVFVVEQNCVYQDIDGKDAKALHVLGKKGHKILAYARLFEAGAYFDHASIGRVVVSPSARALQLGHALMEHAIAATETHFGAGIEISAQQYLQKFYEKHGFKVTSEMYLEDDIPHIRMFRD